MFCFLIGCVKVDRVQIQQPSGFLGANVLRPILILSSHLQLAFSSGLFLKFLHPKFCICGLSTVHSACSAHLTLFNSFIPVTDDKTVCAYLFLFCAYS